MSTPRLGKVLLLDPLFRDEREIYALYLREKGYEVTVCRDAVSAVETARTKHITAVITRVLQPDQIDGLEVTRQLKQDARTRHIPVVVISTLIEARIRTEARAAGCSRFLLLPCNPQRLATALRRAIATRPRKAVKKGSRPRRARRVSRSN